MTLYFTLFFCVLIWSNSAAFREGRCIQEKNQVEEIKYLYYGDNALNLRILTSDRVSHRIASTVVKIFIEEIVGYSNVTLVPLNDPTKAFDPDTLFRNLSSCKDIRCRNLDTLPPSSLAPVPNAMVNVEMWLPPHFRVDDWKVEDLGQLGPGGRFGWYIPERFAKQTPPIKDHWRAFTDENVTRYFIPPQRLRRRILASLKDENNRYNCEEDFCGGIGIYSPSVCSGSNLRRRIHRDSPSNCALMLTDYPILSAFYHTHQVIRQIQVLGLLVEVVFVGKSLPSLVHTLDSSPEIMNGSRSYLIFHYEPSPITTGFNLTNVKFEYCGHGNDLEFGEERLNRPEIVDPQSREKWMSYYSQNCFYSFNRFAKIIWPPLQEVAPRLYEIIRKMEFTQDSYRNMLKLYESSMSSKILAKNPIDQNVINDVACSWLNAESSIRKGNKNYELWEKIGKEKQKLRIGGIFPMHGTKYKAPELVPVAKMAQEHINARKDILDNYELQLAIFDGQCKADIVMKRFIEIITNRDYKSFVGVLGPACSDTVEPIAGVSKHFTTVVITYSAEGTITSDSKNFFRTIAENKHYKYVYLEILKKLGWNRVASLTQDGHKYSEYISHLQDTLQADGISFITNRKFPRDTMDMTLYLNDLRERGARVIIGEFFERAARLIICEAYKLGMTQKQGYVWFLPAWYQYDWFDIDALRNSSNNISQKDIDFLPNCTTQEMREALNGHLSVLHVESAHPNDTMQTGETVGQWRLNLKNELERNHFDPHRANKYSGYVYDAIWVYAYALDQLIKQNKSYIQDIHSERSMNKFVEIINNIDFKGVTGRINFINGPSRLSNIRIIQWFGNETHEIGVYEPEYNRQTSTGIKGRLIEWNAHKLRWQTLNHRKPKDHAKHCSILSSFATSLDIECEHAISIAFLIGFGTLLGIILFIFVIVKRRYERKMRQTEERMRALGLLTPTSVLTLDEWEIHRDRVVLNRKLGEGAFGTVYGGEAFFDEKGWVAVAVKTLKTGSSVEQKIDFLSEAEMMKRFDHKNVVKLLGVCTRNEPVYTVMEFMLYGDLKTYLLARRHLVNEINREELDEVSNRRLTSMALDVAKGLAYLADLKYVHRDIACRNCLVNSSRIVKLADFGMTRPMYENDYYRFNRKGMLPVRWMSPESLADGLFTPMSDVWSYGVLLYEMITFGSFPFQGLSNNQVLEHVKAGNTLSIPSGIKAQLETLLKSCWSIASTKRPTAAEIAELLTNNARLISPCIDVPLASVVVERTDSLELIPSVRKPSGSVSQTNRPVLLYAAGKRNRINEDSNTAPYSPMSIYPPSITSPNNFRLDLKDLKEPLISYSNNIGLHNNNNINSKNSHNVSGGGVGTSSSYVPPGYIVLDHTANGGGLIPDMASPI
ncbi:uncharacterized protein [Lepeophtheirus salmonis]|uniref:uncharacterized protein isoform X2 n=1 Tax=Lepeophtheirus salmonis TaxID=72036 RepID=UPI001AE43BCA|nr:atrial natriuretic peptide receptor 1-like isoform X2 [Lepeophtheirus salmonis]